jgi:hypothetical protein
MFNNANCGYSLADIAAATGNSNGNNNGWGDDGWWIILFLFALFGGWGNGFGGGFGGGNRGCCGNTIREEISYGFDMNGLENGVRGIQQGLCDGFYAVNTSMLNGFSGVQSALCQGFSGVAATANQNTNDIIQTINADTIANMQNTNAIVAQLNGMAAQDAACCCETQRLIERSFADASYNSATQACNTQRAIADSTRDIIDSQNSSTRAILDFLTQDKIASLQAENQTLKFKASQAEQNTFIAANQQAQTAELIRRLGADCPVNAYVVQPPTPVTFPTNCCGQFTGYNNSCGF